MSQSFSDSGSSNRSRAISRGRGAQGTALTLSRVGETCADVVSGELREIRQNLVFGHAAGQVLQDIADRDAEPFFYGNSSARWEGDALVIESIGFDRERR